MNAKRALRIAALALVVTAALALSACSSVAPKLGVVNPYAAQPPQWPLLSDPWVLPANGVYYVFGSNTSRRVPVTPVSNLTQTHGFVNWVLNMTQEAMPQRPAWAFNDTLWAPTVGLFDIGYVMFFSAHYGSTNLQCIGRAFASAPQGPYTPEASPFSCGLDGYRGALDPALFRGPDGQWYLHVAFADTEAPIHVIHLNNASEPGRRPDGQAAYVGAPVLGKNFPWEGRFIENPSMTYDWTTNTYLLAYSAGDWWTAGYSTGLARCGTPVGPCSSNPGGPWLTNGSGRTGPGGLSFFFAYDGSTKAVYASFAAGNEGVGRDRAGTVASVGLGNAPSLGPP